MVKIFSNIKLMSKINGGYPPLKKCKNIEETVNENTGKNLKKRFFAPKQDINIRDILQQKKQSDIFIPTTNNDEENLNIVTDL